jgi:formate dehydrogenase major subunit
MISLSINGRSVEAAESETVLQAAARAGIVIPTLCFDPRISPVGGCRICSVEIEGEPHPQIACRTQVQDGMQVITHSPALEDFRRTLISWEAKRVLPSSFSVEPDKDLHRLLRHYGIAPSGKRTQPRDLSHPLIQVDMSQCIDCLRCVHICEDLQGQFVWHALDRGADMHIVPDSATTLATSSCVACGACVDTCPTSALTDRNSGRGADIENWTRTTCVYCGVGCEMNVGSSKGKITRIRPVIDAPVNKGHLCVKGRYAFSFNDARDRQTRPLARSGRKWVPQSWDAALDQTAAEFTRIAATYGSDSIGVLGSARATNEENYLAQKFARIVLGTNNVDCCARVCHTPSAAALKAMLGAGAATNSFDDLELARTIFVFGANPLENHPVVGARIRQHVLKTGANLIVADPRETELARMASVHLRLRPGTNIALLNGLAHVIATEQLFDRKFLHERVTAWDEFSDFIKDWTPERTEVICGVSADTIRKAARLYARVKPSMSFHGLGLTEHTQGTEGVMALINLALMTGSLGKPGAGINPLRGQNNVQGAAHMGCDPATLTGSVPIDERRAAFETVWKMPIPHSRGRDLLSMMDEAEAGRLKALYVIGYDVLPTLANMTATKRAFRNLEFVVVQDLFITETAKVAGHVFLPAASVFEKDGTFMNAERRIQRVRKATAPPGECRTDWQIICALADRMGHGEQFRYECAEDIWNEVRQVWPEGAGISYSRLEMGGLQWPCRTQDDPGTTILHKESFGHDKRAALRKIEYSPTPEQTSEDFPFLLSTGRTLYQFNSGTMTMRTANSKLRPTDTLDMSPADAERLGAANGGRVRVSSRYGSVSIEVRVTPLVTSGELFATFHDRRVGLNSLTGPFRDNRVQAPEYKVTAVRVERMR